MRDESSKDLLFLTNILQPQAINVIIKVLNIGNDQITYNYLE